MKIREVALPRIPIMVLRIGVVDALSDFRLVLLDALEDHFDPALSYDQIQERLNLGFVRMLGRFR